MEKEEFVEISLNHKGIGLTTIVSVAEAERLWNDETAASDYAERLLQNEVKELEPLEELECDVMKAELRKKFDDKFKDKKTIKSSLWKKIAQELQQNGLDVSEGKDAAEKCRQKFANLQRNYLKHMNSTGAEKKDPPAYFEELHDILGNKDKTTPPQLEDSLLPEPESSSSSGTKDPDIKHIIKNRFKSSHTTRPTSNVDKIVTLMKKQHEEDRIDKERHLDILKEALQNQNNQQERLLTFLIDSKKRKLNSNE